MDAYEYRVTVEKHDTGYAVKLQWRYPVRGVNRWRDTDISAFASTSIEDALIYLGQSAADELASRRHIIER